MDYMITFLIDIFSIRVLRDVLDKPQGFKHMSVWFYNIAVINMDKRSVGDELANGRRA